MLPPFTALMRTKRGAACVLQYMDEEDILCVLSRLPCKPTAGTVFIKGVASMLYTPD